MRGFRSLVSIGLVFAAVLIQLCFAAQKTITVGIDGSIPASLNTWRLARTYEPLTVQQGVQVVFSSYGSHGLVLTTNADDYWNCTGNGTTLLPPSTLQAYYVFDTADYPVGNYYFYNNNLNMQMCLADMRAEVIIVESAAIKCGQAKVQKSCKMLSQCSWQTVNKKKKKYLCKKKPAKSG